MPRRIKWGLWAPKIQKQKKINYHIKKSKKIENIKISRSQKAKKDNQTREKGGHDSKRRSKQSFKHFKKIL
jgi:hypothetical protein